MRYLYQHIEMLKRLVLLLLGFLPLLLLMSSCAYIPMANKDMQPSEITSSTNLINMTQYVMGTGDHLNVTVFGDENLSGEFIIDAAGNISMPLIQEVRAAGHTAEELQDVISSKLHPKYLNDPKVTVQIKQYGDVFVLGEVRLPGKYSYAPNMTVLQAAAVAGGYTYRADEAGATISRLIDGKIQKFKITESSMVSPGDTIYIGRRWF